MAVECRCDVARLGLRIPGFRLRIGDELQQFDGGIAIRRAAWIEHGRHHHPDVTARALDVDYRGQIERAANAEMHPDRGARWRQRAESPMTSRDVAEAAAVLVRSCQGLSLIHI